MTEQISKYPSTFYRVSLKAIIRDKEGRVLAVRTIGNSPLAGDAWDLPGGGMEHGDDEKATLAKELYEEALIEVPITSFRYLGMTPRYTRLRQAWWLGIFYEVELPKGFSYGVGEDSHEVRFIDPRTFKNSPDITEQLIYKWAVEFRS